MEQYMKLTSEDKIQVANNYLIWLQKEVETTNKELDVLMGDLRGLNGEVIQSPSVGEKASQNDPNEALITPYDLLREDKDE